MSDFSQKIIFFCYDSDRIMETFPKSAYMDGIEVGKWDINYFNCKKVLKNKPEFLKTFIHECKEIAWATQT